LNIASWLGECELDAVIENDEFAREMEKQYLADLNNATEVVLDVRSRVSAPAERRHGINVATSGGGSAGRAAAGAIRISNAEKQHPHALKHSIASPLVSANVNLALIKQQLGHKSIGSTMRYVSTSDQQASKATASALMKIY
jgi:cardiolipin synthase